MTKRPSARGRWRDGRDGGVDAEAEYVVAAIVTAVAYIGSLLAHELAHSLVARPLNAGNRLG